VAKGIHRIVCEQIDKALDSLTPQANNSLRTEAVHDARKAFKKVRAVLRLVRSDLGSKVYRRENTCFRDAGRPLTEVRDAKVFVDALDKLTEHFAGQVSARRFAKVRQALQVNQRAVCRRVLHKEDALAKVAGAVQSARKRSRKWAVGPDKWSSVGKGLKRVYQTGLRAFTMAAADPTVANLHEWRKQVKYLWHQLQILEKTWPNVMKGLANQAHELAGHLGDNHDLAMLRQKLVDEAEKFGTAGTREALLALIDLRRDELQQAALLLGRRLYHDRPGAFADRLKTFWKVWRSEAASGKV
jgi:CHAD domain-containing protein